MVSPLAPSLGEFRAEIWHDGRPPAVLVYTVKRLLAIVPTLLVVVTLAFFALRFLPGGPFDRERAVPAEIQAALDARYHIDEPLRVQYWRWLSDLALRGDLGPTFRYPNRTVNEIIAASLPVSATLGVLALIFALAVGVPLGILGATRRGTVTDGVVTGASLLAAAVPSFVLAPLLVLVFALDLHLLPAARWDSWRHAVLPVICTGLPAAAYFARLTRAGVIEVLGARFIDAARARGLPEHLVIVRHALPGGLLPLVGYLGPAASGLLVGSMAIEKLFDVPGMGRYFVEAAANRDYNLVLGVTIVYGVLVMALNTAADLAHGLLDPRVRLR